MKPRTALLDTTGLNHSINPNGYAMQNEPMKKTMLTAAVTLSLVTPAPAFANSVERMAQSTINAQGKDCPSVTAVKALGTTESGTPIDGAACSNGTRHVLKLLPNNTLQYVSTCGVFESMAKVKCF